MLVCTPYTWRNLYKMYTKRYNNLSQLRDYWRDLEIYNQSKPSITNEDIIEAIRKNDTEENRMKLVTNNLALVTMIITDKCKDLIYDVEDLIGMANLGLVKAALTFDVNKGLKFSTYAVAVIYRSILNGMKNKGWATHRSATSLNEPMHNISTGVLRNMEDAVCLQDTLIDTTDLEKDVIIPIIKKNNLKLVTYILNSVKLSPVEQRAIFSYYGFYNDKELNLTQTAKCLGLSLAGTRKVLNRALKKMRDFINIKWPALSIEDVV